MPSSNVILILLSDLSDLGGQYTVRKLNGERVACFQLICITDKRILMINERIAALKDRDRTDAFEPAERQRQRLLLRHQQMVNAAMKALRCSGKLCGQQLQTRIRRILREDLSAIMQLLRFLIEDRRKCTAQTFG